MRGFFLWWVFADFAVTPAEATVNTNQNTICNSKRSMSIKYGEDFIVICCILMIHTFKTRPLTVPPFLQSKEKHFAAFFSDEFLKILPSYLHEEKNVIKFFQVWCYRFPGQIGVEKFQRCARMRSSRVWMRSSRVWMRSSRVWMRSSRVWMRSSRVWMRSSRAWMRSSRVVRVSDSQ